MERPANDNTRQKAKVSLGVRLLRIVFGLYFLITLTVTTVQMTLEYNHSKERMFSTIKQLEDTFESSFSTSLWEYNGPQIKASLDGISQVEIVSGLFITDEYGDEVTRVGYKPKFKRQIKEITRIPTSYERIERLDLEDKSFLARVYEFSFHVYYINEKGKTEYVGKAHIFAKEETVVKIVKHGFMLILVNSVIKTIGLWIVFLICTKILVTDPLNTLTRITNEIDPKNPVIGEKNQKDITKLLTRPDEIGLLTEKYTRLLSKISHDIQTINDLNEGLEKKVELRTQQLSSRNRDISLLLQNMPLAIMTINSKMEIEKEYSKQAEIIFQTTELANKSIHEIVFKESNLNTDLLSRMNTTLQYSFGNEIFNFSVNEHNLPNEIEFKHSQILEILWEPVTANDNIEKIMLIIRDVTQVKKLQLANKKQQQEIKIIGEILNTGAQKLSVFIHESLKLLDESKNIINNFQIKDIDLLFRNMHTIKGNSRTYQLSLIAQVAHEAENYYASIKNDPNNWSFEKANLLLTDVINQFKFYLELIDDKFKSTQNSNTEDTKILSFLDEKLEAFKNSPNNQDLVEVFNQLYHERQIINYAPLSKILNDEFKSLDELAKNLDKKTPKVVIEESNFVFDPKSFTLLKNVFTHCLRNSMDHGLETTHERMENGKSDVGTIFLRVEEHSQLARIKIWDDGRGLNLKALEDKRPISLANNKLTDEEIANLIFQSGVSTQTKVTDISGRGVGMDAVKSFIISNNGDIKLEFTKERTTNGFREFSINIDLPKTIMTNTYINSQLRSRA